MTTAQFALRRTDPPAGGLLLARLRQYRRRLWLGRIAPREQPYVRHYSDSWVSDLQGAGGPTGPQPGEGPSCENGQP